MEGEAQEEQDQAAEAEKDRQMDAPLTEEAAYPTESQVCRVPVALPSMLKGCMRSDTQLHVVHIAPWLPILSAGS